MPVTVLVDLIGISVAWMEPYNMQGIMSHEGLHGFGRGVVHVGVGVEEVRISARVFSFWARMATDSVLFLAGYHC